MEDKLHIATLIASRLKGSLTEEQESELQNWLGESEENQSFFDRVSSNEHQLEKLEVYNMFDRERAWKGLQDELFETKVVKLVTPRYLKLAASFLLPILLATAVIYLFDQNERSLAQIDETVKPGYDQATLILSNGAEMDVATIKAGSQSVKEGDVEVKHDEEGLIYESGNTEENKPLIFNELKTPRGGGYELQLADGTKVWLNAASSLRFPVSFTDTVRQVFLTGEAYFDVSHNGKPFIVSTSPLDVRVLGTEFNVTSYEGDEDVRTTLVEGSVRVETLDDRNNIVIEPGQQARLTLANNQLGVDEVDPAIFTSWVDGKLEFDNSNINEVMKRLARWYDFKYEFQNEAAMNYHFTARLDNSEKLSVILQMLEMTTDVKFEIIDETVIIL